MKFSVDQESVSDIISVLTSYSDDIDSEFRKFEDDIKRIAIKTNYNKLLYALQGIIDIYNDVICGSLRKQLIAQWIEEGESLHSFAEDVYMGEESEEAVKKIENSLEEIFIKHSDNNLVELEFSGDSNATREDFDDAVQIFESFALEVERIKDSNSDYFDSRVEDNELYRFLIPIIESIAIGVSSFSSSAKIELDRLGDNYIERMEGAKQRVEEAKKEKASVDFDLDLFDFEDDFVTAGMLANNLGSVSNSSPEKGKTSDRASGSVSAKGNDPSKDKYEKLIQALRQFDGKACTYPELRKKYDEHLAQFHKNLEIKVKAEYDKRDKALQQYHKQLELQLQSRHKELDGRYIKGTITLQQAEYMYAESCSKADQLYQIRKNTLWQEYQVVKQNADRIYNNEVTRCNQIANKALSAQQEKCRELYNNRNSYIKKLGEEDASVVIELKRITSEIGKTCYGKCSQFKELCAALDIISSDDSFDGLWENIKQTYSPLNKELKGKYPRRKDKLTWSENLEKVNPHYANYPDGSELRVNYQFNCQRCVMTYEARQRGFDVTAKPRKARYDNNTQKWKKDYENIAKCNKDSDGKWVGFPEVYKNPIVEEMYYKDADDARQDIINKMVGYGKGSRIVVAVLWKSRGQVPGGGHVFIVENVNGKPIFCDPQTQKSGVDVEKYFDRVDLKKPIRLMRTDNLEFTDLAHECFG